MDLVTLGVVIACLATGAASVVSSFYIVYVYRQRTEEALFLDRLVRRDVRVAVAAAVILAYLAVSLTGHPLDRPWGAVLIGGAVIVMQIGPVGDALLWFLERRRTK